MPGPIPLVTLAHTGLRISEALSLRSSDWDGGDTVRVMNTKSDRPRAAPVTGTLATELRAWRKVSAAERIASVRWVPAFRAGIAVVVIDPSAPYASGIRASLPDALIAVDHFHLVQLANQMVTDVRQRVAREQLGRRGGRGRPMGAPADVVHRRGPALPEAARPPRPRARR